MKIGLFLGSFDPPHIGHLYVATACVNNNLVDRVIFVPTVQNPDKKDSTDFEHRFAMLSAMTDNHKEFYVSDIETLLTAPYYSYKTIKAIKELYPNDELFLIVGDDIDVNTWKNGQEILDNVNIIIFERFGITKMDYDYYIHPSFPISSTEVRNLIKQNKIISPYVTDLVNKYINIHNLYYEQEF